MMRCAVCGKSSEEADLVDGRVCAECQALGFEEGTHGEVLCPTCGEDFQACGCSAPDSAIM